MLPLCNVGVTYDKYSIWVINYHNLNKTELSSEVLFVSHFVRPFIINITGILVWVCAHNRNQT